ncbi:magnesium transporter CorA family protein [Streptococcus devriesei]|uniref:magnesium transporter CorA family protein n=1 Tax=Streptococcus devriesei TaxID=231233 RepID=UPI0004017DF0|nr:magnesium transporter CorA family protein [Streptococcus devriesei]
MIQQRQFGTNNQYSWFTINAETTDLANVVVDDYQLDTEAITYALDKNERAHIDYDSDKDRLLVVYNALNLKKDDNHYETIPITFIATDDSLITIVNEENRYVTDLIATALNRHEEQSIFNLLFTSLTMISNRYFPVMDEIDREKDRLNALLRKTTTKESLLALSDLETGSVYILAAANQNVLLLEQLKSHPRFRHLKEEELEQLDDALIEARQLASMSQLHSQILQQLSSAFNNVLNNNLNDNLTKLTIMSILLAVLAVITGFFGMNVPLPFSQNGSAWIFISLASIMLWILGAFLLKYLIKQK